MKKISVYSLVYNEESRIENFLKNCLWSEDIIIYDKSSTDRTMQIALKYPCRIIQVPYYNTGSGYTKNIINDAKNEWLLHLSCSDVIHHGLVKKILELINQPGFDYDVIAFPYQVGVLGIIDKHSPWSSIPLKAYLFKKSAVVFSEEVHKEISFKPGSKIYKMKKNDKEAVFHLTHENLDTFFERHIRYTKAEAEREKYNHFGLSKVTVEMFAAILWMIFYKRIFLLKKDGCTLFIAFLSYFMMKYLYIWEKQNKLKNKPYELKRKEILNEWENYFKHLKN